MLSYQVPKSYPIYSTEPQLTEFQPTSVFGKEEWEELTLWYLNSELETISQLELSLAKNDFEQLLLLADKIYGHGESFGFERISLIGKKIELAAIDKNTILLNCLIASLKAYTKNLLRKINVTLLK